MLNKRCPSCQKTITLQDVTDAGVKQSMIRRQPFPCPHCEALIQMPANIETLISVGVLLSVILAPLSFYWQWSATISGVSFVVGAALIIVGVLQNQPRLVSQENEHE